MFDVQAFRAARRACSIADYDVIQINLNYLSEGFRRSLERLLSGPYQLGNQTIASLDPPVPWNAHGASFAFHMNAWNPISPLLMGFSRYGEDAYLRKAWAFARSWIEEFQRPAFAIGLDPKALEKAQGPSAWYDMAVGHRAYRIGYLLDVIARDERTSDVEVSLLYDSMLFHLKLLERPDFFKAGHNHGFYQAIGELAALRRYADEPFARARLPCAIARFRETALSQFHETGVHREHSPGYHFMVMFTLLGARKSGLIQDLGLDAELDAEEEAFSWMIAPSGEIATIGDTDRRNFSGDSSARLLFGHPWLRWLTTKGSEGTPPPAGVRADIVSGYVFARGDADKPDWWYFAQIAGFHSRNHKHADDLSFIWSDRGAAILIDPGRFGYVGGPNTDPALKDLGFSYNDPRRVYIEQTRAHNAVEIDGRAQDRKREPRGTSLAGARMTGGLLVSEAQLCFNPLLGHWRCVVLKPGHFLLTLDWLCARMKQRHDYRQYFHFAPDWLPAPEEGPLKMRRGALSLTVLPLASGQADFTHASGLEEPMLGWYAHRPYELKPCTSLCSQILNTDQAFFATLFTFGENARAGSSAIGPKLRKSELRWSEDGVGHGLKVRRPLDGGDVQVELIVDD